MTVSRSSVHRLRTAASGSGDRYYRRVGVEEGFPSQAPGEPLRVLLVIKCLGYGGAERLLVDMVATVDRSRFNYEVAFVLREQDALVPAIRAGGTPVHSLGAAHNADLRWMAALRRLLVTGRYDVVHFHLPYAAAFGQLVVASLPRSDRPGVVYTEHSLWDRAKLVNRVLLRASMGAASGWWRCHRRPTTLSRLRCSDGPRPWCMASISPSRTP